MKKINYVECNRRNPNDGYYQILFSDFKTNDITVSERSPMSPRNGGFDAR